MIWIIKQLLKLVKKQKLLNELIADKFCLVTKEDILRLKNSKFTYQGQSLSDANVQRVISEAAKFKESFLWEVLKKEIHYQAGLKTVEKAKSLYDLVAGKEAVYLLDTIQTKLDGLEKYNKVSNSRQKIEMR